MAGKTNGFSRREFLGRGMAAVAATVAAPRVMAASVLGKDGGVAPSNRICMGFVGLGGQGSGHLFGGAWTYLPGGYLGARRRPGAGRVRCAAEAG